MNFFKNFPLLKHNYFEYSLVPIRFEDIDLIRSWRNAQLSVLRQKNVITYDKQIEYYTNIIKPTFSQKFPNQMLFSFLNKGKCIGYGGLVHFSWEDKRAEVSFIVDDKRIINEQLYETDFFSFFFFFKKISFDKLKLNKIFTETYDIRNKHINILESAGFKLEGRLKDHIYLDNKYCDSLIHGLYNK